jgi:beta-galactosidase
LFNGLAQAIVQTTREPGEIVLHARAPGLQDAALRLISVPSTSSSIVPVAQPRYLITDWRMSPITPTRPDPNQQIADQDMNSWERIEPGKPQTAWQTARGFAVYRAVFTPPKIVQQHGGRVKFQQVAGAMEIYLNGLKVASEPNAASREMIVAIPPASASMTLSVLIESQAGDAGLLGPVEVVRA